MNWFLPGSLRRYTSRVIEPRLQIITPDHPILTAQTLCRAGPKPETVAIAGTSHHLEATPPARSVSAPLMAPATIKDLATAATEPAAAAAPAATAPASVQPATADSPTKEAVALPSSSQTMATPTQQQQQPSGAGEAGMVGGAATAGGNVARGALIVLEGLDRSGKTTQVKLLEQRFVELGRRVKVMRFPGRSFALI